MACGVLTQSGFPTYRCLGVNFAACIFFYWQIRNVVRFTQSSWGIIRTSIVGQSRDETLYHRDRHGHLNPYTCKISRRHERWVDPHLYDGRDDAHYDSAEGRKLGATKVFDLYYWNRHALFFLVWFIRNILIPLSYCHAFSRQNCSPHRRLSGQRGRNPHGSPPLGDTFVGPTGALSVAASVTTLVARAQTPPEPSLSSNPIIFEDL